MAQFSASDVGPGSAVDGPRLAAHPTPQIYAPAIGFPARCDATLWPGVAAQKPPVKGLTGLMSLSCRLSLSLPLTVRAARVKFPVLNCRTETGVRHFDVAAMFASLWL